MAKVAKNPAPEAQLPVPSPTNQLVQASAYNWMIKKTDEDTGEEYDAPKYKYIPGNPRDYRTDMGTEGTIKINGLKAVGVPFTIQPIAWRGFTANLFEMGEKDWVEIFFIDDQNCVSAILFHGFSYESFQNLLAPLEYDELKLSDVLLTITMDQKKNEKLKAIYHIAGFTHEEAPDKERTKELKAYAREHKLFRKATTKEDQVLHFSHRVYNPFEEEAAKTISQ
jgi:hypothetical protein